MSRDPICGAKVPEGADAPRAEYKTRMYFFCSETCRERFAHAAERVRVQESAKSGSLLSFGKVRWGVA